MSECPEGASWNALPGAALLMIRRGCGDDWRVIAGDRPPPEQNRALSSILLSVKIRAQMWKSVNV